MYIIEGTLPALQDIYSIRGHRKAKMIIKNLNHPSHSLFTPLASRDSTEYRDSTGAAKLGPRD